MNISNCLVLSLNYADGGPCNFALLDANHNLTQWSSVTNLGDGFTEIKIATAKMTTNGYTVGDLFFGNTLPGGIGRVSADGTAANITWLTISPEDDPLAGDLYLDQTGIWGHDLLAVAGTHAAWPGTRDVWRVNAATGIATLVTNIPTGHLEGVLTLPNDARYGPWAGKLLTGDEGQKVIYAVDTNGNYRAYGRADGLDISPDTFRLIPAASERQNLYCCAIANGYVGYVLKLSWEVLAPHAGDVLVVQSGEVGLGLPGVYVVHWNGSGFTTWSFMLGSTLGDAGFSFEKAVFAPIDIPLIPQ